MKKTHSTKSVRNLLALTAALLGTVIILTLALSGCGSSSASSEKTGFDTSRNIAVIAREDGSGTKSAFMEIIGHKGKADPINVVIQNGTAGILAEVKGNPSAIAYESLGYVTGDVKMLDIDGIEATVENIQSGSYKLSRPLSVVYKDNTLEDAVYKAFLTYLQSADAQAIISAEPFVSIYGDCPSYVIDPSLSGTIDISGSTSLQPLMVLLAEDFEALQPNVSVSVSGGGSGTGYNNAQEGVSEFGMISEEFNQEKAPDCTHYIVAKDGIAVIVHIDNPLDNITMEQLGALYDENASGTVKWSGLIG